MAGPFFVDDGGDGTTGTSWATAETALQTGLTAASAGEILYVGHNTVESFGASQTLTSNGTASNPTKVISATQGSSPTSYAAASAAQYSVVGASNFDLTLAGSAHWIGLYFNVADDFQVTSQGTRHIFENCTIEGSNTACNFVVGNTTDIVTCELINTTVNFSAAGGGGFTLSGQIFRWRGVTLQYSGTQSATLFTQNSPRFSLTELYDSDLSAYSKSGGYYFDMTSTNAINRFTLVNCKLHATPSIYNGTVGKPESELILIGCDDTTGNKIYRHAKYNYYGELTNEVNCVRASGLSLQGTANAWKMVSKATAIDYFTPFLSLEIEDEFNTTGSKTVTVEIVHDNATALQDDEVWLEFDYLGASAHTQATFTTDRMASPTATAANQATSVVSWSGSVFTGMANANKQKLSATVTVNRAGPFRVRIGLAKPSYTIYVCPKVDIS